MKVTFMFTGLLIAIGVAQAGDMQQEKAAVEQASPTLQATAVRLGVGDNIRQFEDVFHPDESSLGDWTDLRSQEIYGSF